MGSCCSCSSNVVGIMSTNRTRSVVIMELKKKTKNKQLQAYCDRNVTTTRFNGKIQFYAPPMNPRGTKSPEKSGRVREKNNTLHRRRRISIISMICIYCIYNYMTDDHIVSKIESPVTGWKQRTDNQRTRTISMYTNWWPERLTIILLYIMILS